MNATHPHTVRVHAQCNNDEVSGRSDRKVCMRITERVRARTHATHASCRHTRTPAHPETRIADGAHTVLIAASLGILAIVVRVGAILCILVVAICILRLLPVAILRLLPVCLVAASHDTSTATRTRTCRRQAERESERASDRETVCRSNANSTGAAASSRASLAPGDPRHAPAGARL